jgi:hypothetical protein
MKQKNSRPLLIPACAAFVLLTLGVWDMHTSLVHGTFPLVGWETKHSTAFGTLWLIVFVVVLLPAYMYAIALGTLGVFGRNEEYQPAPRFYWTMAANITCLLVLLTFCVRVAVTAWFPSQMHPPLDDYRGGVVPGVIATLFMVFVAVTFYKVARSL